MFSINPAGFPHADLVDNPIIFDSHNPAHITKKFSYINACDDLDFGLSEFFRIQCFQVGTFTATVEISVHISWSLLYGQRMRPFLLFPFSFQHFAATRFKCIILHCTCEGRSYFVQALPTGQLKIIAGQKTKSASQHQSHVVQQFYKTVLFQKMQVFFSFSFHYIYQIRMQ
jgi:hypothetical protein